MTWIRSSRLPKLAVLILIAMLTTHCSIIRDLTTERPATVDSKEMALRRDIVDYARRYEGVNYLSAGKKPASGFDCSGFTSFVMAEFDIQLSPSARDQALQGKSKPVDKVQPGDLIFFRRSAFEPIFHVSLVVSNDGKSLKVIHSTTSRGVIMEDIKGSTYWEPKIHAARDVIRK